MKFYLKWLPTIVELAEVKLVFLPFQDPIHFLVPVTTPVLYPLGTD